MKSVVLKRPVLEVTEYSDVSIDKYYVVVDIPHRWSGFITREDYSVGNFRILCFDSLTNSNGVTKYEKLKISELSSFIERLLTDGLKVYEFDTMRELCRWVSEAKEVVWDPPLDDDLET